MTNKVLLLLFTFSNAGLMFLVLCLGTQNLTNRNSLNLGFSSTPAYPNGFILGASITLGILSGGTTSALLISRKD